MFSDLLFGIRYPSFVNNHRCHYMGRCDASQRILVMLFLTIENRLTVPADVKG